MEIVNGKISDAWLGVEGHGIFSVCIVIEGDGWGQGMGHYSLDGYDKEKDRRYSDKWAIPFLRELLNVLEVKEWNKLSGTMVRIERTHDKIYRIGHIIKDQWFDPEEFIKKYKEG